MKIGTKSVLYGAHAFWLHPFSVLLAWRRLYKRWPRWYEAISIALHDIGYWGCADMDGPQGKQHPHLGALWSARIVALISRRVWLSEIPGPGMFGNIIYCFTACHSRDFVRQVRLSGEGIVCNVSPLYHADKLAICYDPAAFYLFRTRLSGELAEFKQRAIDSGHISADATDQQWLAFYRANVLARPEIAKLL